MPAAALAKFNADATQCNSLITSAHRVDGAGHPLFSPADRAQITQAAFLNLFIAWEAFLEDVFAAFMSGRPTISGTYPVKFISPSTLDAAKAMVVGTQRYFDYANIEFVRKLAGLYFQNGGPFEPHLSSSQSDISDMRTMRNASAHITTTTQKALEALAQRVLTIPASGITLYTLLMTTDPGSATGDNVYGTYRDKLLATAQLIAG